MTEFTEDRKVRFLEAFRETCNVTVAARKVGVATSTVSAHRKSDPLFEERYLEAEREGVDLLEHEAHRRAFKGTERGVYHKGELIDTVQEYSDPLAMFLLKSHRPEKYRERAQLDANINMSLADVIREARSRVDGR